MHSTKEFHKFLKTLSYPFTLKNCVNICLAIIKIMKALLKKKTSTFSIVCPGKRRDFKSNKRSCIYLSLQINNFLRLNSCIVIIHLAFTAPEKKNTQKKSIVTEIIFLPRHKRHICFLRALSVILHPSDISHASSQPWEHVLALLFH